MIKVYNNFVNDFLYADASNMLVFLENHDTQRFNQIYPSINDYRLGLTLIATVRGIPQIYYGSEIGMKGEKNKGDADIRRDFPGGWEGDTKNAFTGQAINNEEKYYLDFTKKLFNWRKNAVAIHEGKTVQFVPENNVYVYFRIHEKQTVMVVMNNSKQEQTLDLNRFNEVLTDYHSGAEIFTNISLNLVDKSLKIAPKTAFIFELK
jgi:glycosidase